jgi:hypothetical protein
MGIALITNNILTDSGASLTGYVPYTGATANVNLGDFDLNPNNVNINGDSGGAGGALRFRQAAGSQTGLENYSSISTLDTGVYYFSSYVQSIGAPNFKNFVLNPGGLTNNTVVTYNLPNTSGTLALLSNIPAVAGFYLPLTGGTLTGALSGTSATFSDAVTINMTAGNYPRFISTVGAKSWEIGYRSGTTNYELREDGTTRFSVANGGAATFTGSVTATAMTIVNSNPALTVTDNTNTSFFATASSGGAYGNGTTAGDAVVRGSGGISLVPAGGAFTALKILNNGNVGIGTTAATTKTHIVGSASTGGVLRIENNVNQGDVNHGIINLVNTRTHAIGNDASIMFSAFSSDVSMHPRASIGMKVSSASVAGDLVFNTRNDSNFAERMRITSGGSILFGTTTLSTTHAYFENAGSSRMVLNLGSSITTSANLIAFNNPNGNVGLITTNGTSTSYNTSSDYRLKQDFKDYNGLNLVSKIRTYDYEWKCDKSRMYGIVAHELAEVLPYAVVGIKDGEQMQGVDYSKIVPVMVQAIKELKAELDTATTRLQLLENK